MAAPETRITVIAADPAEADSLARLVRQAPKVAVRVAAGQAGTTIESHAQGLGRLNGTAVGLAAGPGILVARLGPAGSGDLDAAVALAGAPGTRARLVVLSDPDLPFADVRRLTRAGVAEVLPMPVAPDELDAVLGRLLAPAVAAVPAATGRAPGRVLTVARARGGIGATTLAVNLADALAAGPGRFRRPRPTSRVALVDLDLQFGAVASFLDLEPADTLYGIATGEIRPDAEGLEAGMLVAANGVRVLSAPRRLVPLDALDPGKVGRILDTLRDRHDWIVVDLPHALAHWVQAVIERTDRLMLVTDSTVPSVRQARRLIDVFREETPALPVEVVMGLEARPLFGSRRHGQAARLLERPLRTWLPPDPRAAREALDRGVPLSVAARRSPLAKSIRRLAAATLSEIYAPAARS